MKNSIGNSVIFTVFGESHGPGIGCVIDGLAPGIPVDEAVIADYLSRRRPDGPTDTARKEADEFKIVSGVHNGRTTGTPLCIMIPNTNVRRGDYERTGNIARPGHADFSAQMKYHGYQDWSGGGHFSGRVTAAVVAAGAICSEALAAKGVKIGTHILSCAGIEDRSFDGIMPLQQIESLKTKTFPVLDDESGEAMKAAILQAKAESDSVGGKIQTAVYGLPAGVGEPWFDSLEGSISRAIFAIGGIKGIEFGSGFGLAEMRGSEANDPFRVGDDGKIHTLTNNSGGINGGISNGMPIIFNMAVRPTPSIARKQQSVDYINGCNAELELQGRHDPAILRRICPVVSCMTAIVLCDVLSGRYGTDFLSQDSI